MPYARRPVPAPSGHRKKHSHPDGANIRTAEKGSDGMKCIGGYWYYHGQCYDTLHEALVAIWPR